MKKTTKIRIFKFGTIFSGMITVILSISDVIVKNIINLIMGIEMNLNESSSIGIIGGADGPTAIYIATSGFKGFKYVLIAIFLISTIISFVKWRKLQG